MAAFGSKYSLGIYSYALKGVIHTENLTLAAGIIALVKAIKDNVPQVNGVVTLGVALILGAVAGYFNLLGTPDVLSGIFTGAGAVGAVTLVEATKK